MAYGIISLMFNPTQLEIEFDRYLHNYCKKNIKINIKSKL
jgi:hypothetical protein